MASKPGETKNIIKRRESSQKKHCQKDASAQQRLTENTVSHKIQRKTNLRSNTCMHTSIYSLH